MLLPWQPKKQYSPRNLAAETAIMAHVVDLWYILVLSGGNVGSITQI